MGRASVARPFHFKPAWAGTEACPTFLKTMPNLPHFSRSQLGVAILLGTGLLVLWAWRANFFLAPSPPPAQPLELVFVEVAGAAAHPGVYQFDHSPALAEVWKRGGMPAPVPPGETKLVSGTLVEVDKDGKYRLGRMTGERLLTLGLALDLNTAGAPDLEALPGIGPALAGRIIAYRQSHGPFKKIDDLMEVSGIGPQNLAKLKPHLVLGSPEAPASSEGEETTGAERPVNGIHPEPKEEKPGPVSRRGAGLKQAPGRVIDPNLASPADLETLPGIGPVLARRILAYRSAHGSLKRIADLKQVSGIGPKKLEKMKPYLIIDHRSSAGADQDEP